MPLVVEKLISIVDTASVTKHTRRITLKIEAEDGFDPQQDLDIESLRFGSDSVVNYGRGCKAVGSKAEDKDLLVYFEGASGINYRDYDFKLLGQTKTGDLVFGYALLPGRSATAPTLITLPINIKVIDDKKVLESAIENWGLEASGPCNAIVLEHGQKAKRVVQEIQVPSIKPYESTKLSVPLKKTDTGHCEYEIVMVGDDNYEEFWHKVDDMHQSVVFTGHWQEHPEPDEKCYMGNEMVSTTIGDSVRYNFYGTRARVYGRIGRGMGAYDVYVDGKYIENVRCHWAPVPRSKIYQTGLLPEGQHTIELKKAKAEDNGEVTIDAFAYESPFNSNGEPFRMGHPVKLSNKF